MAGPEQDARGWRRTVLRFTPLVVLFAAMLAVLGSGLHHRVTFQSIVDHRDDLRAFVGAHYGQALLLYVGVYVSVVALSLPGGLVLTLLGGFLFGWLVGGIAAIIGATLGAIIVFLAARTSLGSLLAAKAGPALSRVLAGFRNDAVSYMLFLRLVPLVPFWLVNLAPALAGVPLAIYAATTIIGIVPGTFAFAVAGAGLDSLIAAQKAVHEACVNAGSAGCQMRFEPRALLTPGLMAGLAALGFAALIPLIIKLTFKRRMTNLDGRSPAP